jgi:hypothetical protein
VSYHQPLFCCNYCQRVYVDGRSAGVDRYYCDCKEYHCLCRRCQLPNGYHISCEDCGAMLTTIRRRRAIRAL